MVEHAHRVDEVERAARKVLVVDGAADDLDVADACRLEALSECRARDRRQLHGSDVRHVPGQRELVVAESRAHRQDAHVGPQRDEAPQRGDVPCDQAAEAFVLEEPVAQGARIPVVFMCAFDVERGGRHGRGSLPAAGDAAPWRRRRLSSHQPVSQARSPTAANVTTCV